MAEHFDCCGYHVQCQTTGQCVYKDVDNPVMDYNNCTLYKQVISFKFPTLYSLKERGFVEIQSNHLTTAGIEEMRTVDGRLYMMMNIIFILGLNHNNRLYPQEIYKKLIQAIKILNI